jgi:hypothetical protein
MDTIGVIGLVAVYHADGGPVGETKYVIGKLLGTSHCALCDITHSRVRRKPAWDAMVAGLGVPVVLLHLNEMPPDVAREVAAHGSPLLLARTSDGRLGVVLDHTDLDGLRGSVAAFDAAARASMVQRGLRLPNAEGSRGPQAPSLAR